MLEEAGYAVIVATDPDMIRVLQVTTVAVGGGSDVLVLRAAMDALRLSSSTSTKEDFGKRLASLVSAALTERP